MIHMARSAKATPPAIVDPFSDISVYEDDAFANPKGDVSPTIMAIMKELATVGRRVVDIEGWERETLNQFNKELRIAKETMDLDGRLYTKRGRIRGTDRAALLLSYTAVEDEGTE